MKLTGDVAQIFMTWWDKQIHQRFQHHRIEMQLYKRYVDDINDMMKAVQPGTRYNARTNTLSVTEEGIVADVGKKDDERTMNIFKAVGESIHESVKLTIDFPSKHTDGKMPSLDLKLWLEEREGGRITLMYEHYEKDISSKYVIHAKSAMPMKSKLTILTQEMIRILTHCSPFTPWEGMCEHVNKFMRKLQFSGYSKKFRYHVADSGIKAFRHLIIQATEGIRPINRPRNWNKEERERQKKEKKTRWYKRDGFESVMFIPATPDGKLRKIYQQKVTEKGFLIKVVEMLGKKVKHALQKTNPFKEETCGKTDCFPCTTGSRGDCRKESATYRIECEDDACGENNIYNGETGSNTYTRGKEHLSALQSRDERNCLWRHTQEKHGGIPPAFKMVNDEHFKNDTMLRQITEAVSIRNTPLVNVMNTRAEWNMPRVPRAQININ